MEISDLLSVLTITVTINVTLLTIFYSFISKKAKNIVKNEKEIERNKLILQKTINRQTICLEQLFARISDTENLIERLANQIDNTKRQYILKCRNIICSKNRNILKNIDELKLFGENEYFRLSAFNRLISTGDIDTLDFMLLKIKTEKNPTNRYLYNSYKNRLKRYINSQINITT